jgi:hypothetical protein
MGACISSPQHTDSNTAKKAVSCCTSWRHEEEVSNQLSAAVDNQHGSGIVISLAGDSNYLNPKNWTANLDVPVIKYALAL